MNRETKGQPNSTRGTSKSWDHSTQSANPDQMPAAIWGKAVLTAPRDDLPGRRKIFLPHACAVVKSTA